MTKISTTSSQANERRETDRKRRADANASQSQQEQMRTRLAAAQAAQTRQQERVQAQLRIHAHGVLIASHGADAAARAAAARARADAAASDPNPETRFDSVDSYMPGGFFSEFTDSGDSDGSGQNDGAPEFSDVLGADFHDDSLSASELAALLPTDGNNGVFELLLPTGASLGVVVSSQPSALSYLLSPSDDKLAAKLRRGRMELEDKLGRLTHRNVNITVL